MVLCLTTNTDSRDWTLDVDTALAQVYSAHLPEALLQLMEKPNDCDTQHLVPHLTANKRHHALAVLYSKNGQKAKALEIWQQ